MSTDDQKLTAVIQGEAVEFARDEIPQELLEHPAEAADGRDDLSTKNRRRAGWVLDG
jgi:hypothetical protein